MDKSKKANTKSNNNSLMKDENFKKAIALIINKMLDSPVERVLVIK